MDAAPVLWLVGLAGLLVLVDRLVAWTWHRRRPRERSGPRIGVTGGPGLGDLIELYQPGARHLFEEQERQRHDLVVEGDAAPPWALDLDAGTAMVGRGAGGGPGAAGRGAGASRTLTEVSPGVWTATAVHWSSLTTVVVADDGNCLVVDPGITVAEVAALTEEIAARGWTPVAGFSTHPHWDHVLWSAGLGEGLRWATPTAVDRGTVDRPRLLAETDADAPGHDPALTARLTPLPAGAEDVPWSGPRTAVVPYPGHCVGSAALVVAGVLIAGDMLSDVEIPLLDLEAADPVGDYRLSLDLLERAAETRSVHHVIPGHGTVGDRQELTRRLAADRAYLDALQAGAGVVVDDRLADPEQAAQHERQVRRLSS